MENEKRNYNLFASLVNDICGDILLKCFVKKIEIAKTCFKDFLLDERHTFYHLLSEHKCCECTAYPRTGSKCMCQVQWGCLYTCSRNRPCCKKDIDYISKYDVKTNVKSSELDISLCSILLLNSGILNTFEWEKCHIKRIRKYRNYVQHHTSREIDNNTFQSLWNEAALSVTQLARACSLELAVQTEEKINLARMPQQCYQEMAMIPDEYPQCVKSVEYENERGLILETSVGAVHEAVERLNQCLTPMLQQRVTHDITRIRARLMNDEYKDHIITNMDANIVIESMKNKGLFSNSDAQQLCNIGEIRNRSDRLLQILPSKDDAFVDSFLHSLLETQQHLIHSFIQGSDSRSKLRLILECDIPQPHPVGVDLSLHIKLNNRFDLESKILDALQREADEINELTMMFANLSIHDIGKGSIIIRLKSENKNAIEKFYNAFLNGRVFGLFEEILKRISILDELIHDQVNVVVKISIDGIPKEPSTFFERNWKHLVDELSPRPVAALLLERGVLTKADIKEIFHADNLTRFSQSHSLIHNLNLEHNETMVDFKQCLSLTSQHYILKNAIVDDIPQVEPMLTSKVQDESSYTEEETKHSYSEKDTEHKCSTKKRKKQHPTEAISYKTRKIEVLEETEGTSYDSGATGPFTDVYGSDSDSCYDMGRPSLLKQFQVILDEYPDNSQILTEMVQNAEDAGATQMKIFYDEEQTESPVGNMYAKYFKAPALCVYNDAKFTAKDWDGIGKIYDSNKQKDPLKIGRFGLGFKSVFHMTDHPVIISGKKLLIIDPCKGTEECIPIPLKKINEDKTISRALEPIIGKFGFTKDSVRKKNYNGTLFWFPLREEASPLSKYIYTSDKVKKLIQSFEKEASHTLLFLRHMRKLQVYDKKIDKSYVNFSVENFVDQGINSKEEFYASIQKLGNEIPPENLSCNFQSRIVVQEKDHTPEEEKWAITGLFKGKDGMSEDLKKLIADADLNYSPLVGIAVPLSRENQSQNSKPFGHVFCVLPLPMQKESLTGFRVHINGFFSLSQNRHNVKWPTSSEQHITDKCIQWNRSLCCDVLIDAFFSCVEFLKGMAMEIERITPENNLVYQALPHHVEIHSDWTFLIDPLYGSLLSHEIFFTENNGGRWISEETSIFSMFEWTMTSKEKRSTIENTVMEVLLQQYDKNVVCIPEHVQNVLLLYRPDVRIISPRLVRGILKDNDAYKRTSSAQKLELCTFILSDLEENADEIGGLELLPIKAKSFKTFSESAKTIYYCIEEEDYMMFPNLEMQFSDFSDFDEESKTRIKRLVSEGFYQLKTVQDDMVPELLSETLKANGKTESELFTATSGKLTEDWLKRIWRFITDRFVCLDKFEQVHIIPYTTRETFLKVSGNYMLHKSPGVQELSEETVTALSALSITVVKDLPSFINHQDVRQKYFKPPTVQSLMELLHNLQSHSSLSIKHFNECSKEERMSFANFLEGDLGEIKSASKEVLQTLKSLKMFQQSGYGSPENVLVSVKDNAYVACRKDFPFTFPKPYLSSKAVEVTKSLGAIQCSWKQVVQEMLKMIVTRPTEIEMSDKNIRQFMDYFIQHISHFVDDKEHLQMAKQIPFVPTLSNGYQRPMDLFDPMDKRLQDLFLLMPNSFPCKRYRSEQTLIALRCLGLKSEVSEYDMICVIQTVNQGKEKSNSMEQERHICQTLFTLLCEHSTELVTETFVNSVHDLEWVPCQTTRPEKYPEMLPWNCETLLCKSGEAYALKYQNLAGSSAYMVDVNTSCHLSKLFGWDKPPPTAIVAKQLQIFVEKYKHDGLRFGILQDIYAYFESADVNEIKNILQDTCFVYAENGFRSPSEVFIDFPENMENLDLTPYMFGLKEFVTMKTLFVKLGCTESVDKEILVNILSKIATKHEQLISKKDTLKRDLKMCIAILQRISLRKDGFDLSRILVPIHTAQTKLELKPAPDCTFCIKSDFYENEENEEESDEEEEDGQSEQFYVHRDVPVEISKALKIPSVTSRFLSDQKVDLIFESCGQSEPLTTRLSNLLEDYGDGFAVLKELIQNAEDAGASKISFMYDERQNNDLRSKVIENMAECQGPAFWVFNDGMFDEKDFKNITKLGGRTKEADRHTIGKFGLGFCSVYNLTDVPSFISGNSMVIFDPHASYLGNAIVDKSNPGIRISLESDKVFRKYKHQFQVFHDVFKCDMKSNSRYYKGTIFRLPLRTKEQAVRSEIKKLCYNSKEMLQLLQKLESSLGDLLIFNQNLKDIELWHHGAEESNPVLVSGAHKDVLSTFPSEMIGHSIIRAAGMNLDDFKENRAQQIEVHQEINIKVTLKKSSFTKRTKEKVCNMQWKVSWSTGRKRAREMAANMTQKGALSLGSVAVSLHDRNPKPFPFDKLHLGFCKESRMFCFLPLPQKSYLPIHMNGCFAVNNDRKQIRSATDDDKSTEDSSWNDALISDPICEAFVNLLVQLNQIKEKTRYGYSLLWPKDEPTSLILESFYTNVTQQNPCVFRNSRNIRASFSDCVFLARELNYDKTVGKAAFACLLDFYGKNGEIGIVMDMDKAVLDTFIKVGFQQDLQQKTISTYDFYKNIFLPNIQSITDKNDRDGLVLFAINHEDEELRNLLKHYACVPTLPKDTLRKPEDLVRPRSEISSLFDKSDERFVSGTKATFLSESVLDVLANLGMMHNRMPKEIVIDRAMSVSTLVAYEEQENRCKVLLAYLQKEDDFIAELSSVDFLPVCRRPDNWPLKWQEDGDSNLTRCYLKAPKDLYLERTKCLVGCTRYIVDSKNIGSDNVSELLLLLGCSDKDQVVTDDVILQLEAVSNSTTASLSKDALMEINDITNQIYGFLDDKLASDEEIDLRHFCDQPVLLVRERLICPRRATTLLLHGLDCEPVLYNVTKKYRRLFKAVGVRDVLMTEDVVNIICDLQSSYAQQSIERLNDAQIKLHANLLQLLVKITKDSNDDIQTKDMDRIMLPDDESVLRHAKDLCIDDGYSKLMRHDYMHFVNENILPSVYKLLNIKSKRYQHLSNISCAMPFGQKEELVTRIKGILDNYPIGHSILNELLQNADDAGASEINFVLDKRYHGYSDIFGDSWKDLQGPALCVYNNTCFTAKDLDGIVSLGKGSKSNDPTKTGQFGIGFNAVYHITDAPSFISIGETTPNGGTFCAFDPHCEYCPTATQEQPGMRIADLKELEHNYPGVYKCYLQRELLKQEGTWFRFPLRTTLMALKSKLSNKATEIQVVEDLFKQFQGYLLKSLLFLRNIRTVTLSVVTTQGKISNTYSVSADIEQPANERLHEFFQNCNSHSYAIKIGEKLLNEIPMEQISYIVNMQDSFGESQRWIIAQTFGHSSKNKISERLIAWVRDGEIGLSPKGGVAVNISKELRNADSYTDCVFCSLPTSICTGLPVHINGHFALDPNRQYIKKDIDIPSPSGQWNKYVLGNLIPEAYVKALETLRDYLFQDIPSSSKLRYMEWRSDAINKYHCFFPLYRTMKSDFKDTITEVYKTIIEEEKALFPVLQRKSVWWVSLKTTGHKFLAYFDDLEEIFRQDIGAKRNAGIFKSQDDDTYTKDIEKSRTEAKELSCVLRDNGMKIIDTSFLCVYENMTTGGNNDEVTELTQSFQTVSAAAILKFLSSIKSTTIPDGCSIQGLGCHVNKSSLQSLESVKQIIDFCLKKEFDLFSESLFQLPLLLTNAMTLNRFGDVGPVYLSKFCDLLPKSSEHFVAMGLVNALQTVQRENSGILKHLQLATFCEMLPNNFSRQELEHRDPIPWTRDKKPLTSKWICKFWSYVDSLDRLDFHTFDKHLGYWCLVPAVYRKKRQSESVLVPVGLAYIILDVNTFEKDREVFSSLEILTKHNASSASTLCQLVASAQRPISILKSLHHHRDILSNAENETKDKIMQWLNEHLDTPNDSSIKGMLKLLPLYKTVERKYASLDACQHILILKKYGIHDLPLDGIAEWATNGQYVLLYHNYYHERIQVLLGAQITEEDKFYEQHLLPRFQNMGPSFHLKHLRYIKNNLRFPDFATVLQNLRFVPTPTGFRTAGQYFNPHIRLCSVMCSQDQLPPEPFNKKEWEHFMICAGMKNEVTVDMLETYAIQIQSQGAAGMSKDVTNKSEELLNHLFKRENLLNEGILSRIKDIRFVVPYTVASHLFGIYPQYNENRLICFSSSASHNCQQLIWSTMSVLQRYADPALKDLDCKSEIQKQLGISVIPPVMSVVSHVHNVCSSLQKISDKNKLGEYQIQHLMENFYAHLQKHGKCEEAKTGLSETPLVLIPDKQCFVKATQVVENILTEQEIPPFLLKIPLRYGPYLELFKYYGGTENATLAQYAETLKCFYNTSTDGYLLPGEELKNAGKAMNGLFDLLSKKTDEEIRNAMKDVEILYLLNDDKSKRRCMKSTEMVVPDNKSYKARLQTSELSYVPKHKDNEIYKKLPSSLQPSYLGGLVAECLFSENNEIIADDEKTNWMQQLLQSIDFRRGVKAISKKTSHSSGSAPDIADRLKNINVCCLGSIVTVLQLRGTRIMDSKQTVKCFIQESSSTIFVIKENWEVNSFLKAIKDPVSNFICRICEIPVMKGRAEIKELLDYTGDLKGLKSHVQEMTNDDEEENEDDWCPVLGSHVPIALHCLLDNNFSELEVGNIVAYEIWDSAIDEEESGDDQIFLYAKINSKDFFAQTDILDQEYCIDLGEKGLKKVHALKLYRFIRKPTEKCTDVVLFTDGREGATSLNKDAIFKQIRQTLRNAWKKDEIVRKRVVKRLLLRWHPDKNLDCQELSTQVTQYIFEIIRRLENGEPLQDETFTKSHYHGYRKRSSRHPQPFRESSDSFKQWRTFGDRMKRRYSEKRSNYGHSTYVHVPNPQPGEARRWIKQAKFDLLAAKTTMPSAKDAKAFNWVCVQCHQACEKAWKAVGIAEDMGLVNMKSHNLIYINSNLSLDINETIRSELRQMEDVVKSYTGMRYPDALAFPAVPAEVYKEEDAVKALKLAESIVDQLSDALQL